MLPSIKLGVAVLINTDFTAQPMGVGNIALQNILPALESLLISLQPKPALPPHAKEWVGEYKTNSTIDKTSTAFVDIRTVFICYEFVEFQF
jgi:hypothetical protein